MAKRTRDNIPADAGPEFFRQRILDRTDRSGDCWLWTRPLTRLGYARTAIGSGRRTFAHRLSYELFVGPIPPGLQIDHLCRVRHCVNPDHLEAVTSRENTMRGESPMARARRTGVCKRGHDRRAPDALNYRGQCRKCKVIAERERRLRREAADPSVREAARASWRKYNAKRPQKS